jgi:hypothetical protein
MSTFTKILSSSPNASDALSGSSQKARSAFRDLVESVRAHVMVLTGQGQAH